MPKVVQITEQEKLDIGFRAKRGSEFVPCRAKPEGAMRLVMDSKPQNHRRTVQSIAAAVEKREKIRVAAYCRVSTLLDSQEMSLSSQKEHYEEMIASRAEWEAAGIYLEAGITGTKADIRPELQRLMADCRAGKIDLILTKSISRFSRSTSDCLEMVRALTALGTEIFFEKENIHTKTAESEFMLSILACLAEDESRSISGNLKWGLRKRFENNMYRQSCVPYGYRRIGDRLVIDPDESEIIKEIFDAVLSGRGADTIARYLNQRGVPSRTGAAWQQQTVRGIVRNPVYVGDALYQKTFRDDGYRQRKNSGELARYYIRGHHEAIISREDFERAARSVRQRGLECGTFRKEENAEQAEKRQYRSVFSGKLFCSDCGSVLYRHRGRYSSVFFCAGKRKNRGGCSSGPELEDNIKNTFLTVLNKLSYSQGVSSKYRVIDRYLQKLYEKEQKKDHKYLAELNAELFQVRQRLDLLTAAAMTEGGRPEYKAEKLHLLQEEERIKKKKLCLDTQATAVGQTQKLKTFISHWKITADTDDFPENFFQEQVERAVITSGHSIRFFFTCGLVLEEPLMDVNNRRAVCRRDEKPTNHLA